MFSNVDGLTGEVRRSRVPFGRGCVPIDMHQMLLEFDRPNRRVDLQWGMKVGVVSASQSGEKLLGPGTAVTAVCRKPFIDLEGVAGRKSNQ